jgi:hypothetical protein
MEKGQKMEQNFLRSEKFRLEQAFYLNVQVSEPTLNNAQRSSVSRLFNPTEDQFYPNYLFNYFSKTNLKLSQEPVENYEKLTLWLNKIPSNQLIKTILDKIGTDLKIVTRNSAKILPTTSSLLTLNTISLPPHSQSKSLAQSPTKSPTQSPVKSPAQSVAQSPAKSPAQSVAQLPAQSPTLSVAPSSIWAQSFSKIPFLSSLLGFSGRQPARVSSSRQLSGTVLSGLPSRPAFGLRSNLGGVS